MRRPSNFRKVAQRMIKADASDLNLLVYALIIGVIAGALSSIFRILISQIEKLRSGLYENFTFSFSSILEGIGLILLIVSAILIALFLVKKFAPEAAGSGIQEIEGALDEVRPMNWKRVLPVKFIASIFSLGSGMLLGREGPTVQIGANVGKMIKDLFKQPDDQNNPLLSAGAAAGLASAFNAPLSGIVFVIEEMEGHFKFNFYSVAAIMIGSGTADIVVRAWIGNDPVIKMNVFSSPNLSEIWLFVLLGLFFSVIGYAFNTLLLKSLDYFENLKHPILFFSLGFGVIIAILSIYFPDMIGAGYTTISHVLENSFTIWFLIIMFLVRLVLSILSYSSGVPGGIFAPLLTLGVIFGMIFGYTFQELFPGIISQTGIYAVAGMAAIFASTVRAPLTGIMLAIEITSNYELTLPLIVTTVTASVATAFFGNKPIYTSLLKRTMRKNVILKREKSL
ncbi:H(+)/Cl(-) exchange transporter ClcA [Zhouia sp. PK063]|uniref:H(+)/Cl(-) exchange transporter ClcA n=1 Tax=Zhouia sp. PK063 TaxID=3373602 RepID=UPI003793E0AD